MANITKIKQKTSDGYEEYDFLNEKDTWVCHMTLPAGATITNGFTLTWSEEWEETYKYEPGTGSLRVYWDGILLKEASDSEDGHYIEYDDSDVGKSGSIRFYRTSSDGTYTTTDDVIITIIGKEI